MNPKRTADLQRRLSMAPVPTPPEGLADRIKGEIPDLENLRAAAPPRARRSTFSLRVAASIIFLASSAFLAVQLLTRTGTERLSVPSAVQRPREEMVAMPEPTGQLAGGVAPQSAAPRPPASALQPSIVQPDAARSAAVADDRLQSLSVANEIVAEVEQRADAPGLAKKDNAEGAFAPEPAFFQEATELARDASAAEAPAESQRERDAAKRETSASYKSAAAAPQAVRPSAPPAGAVRQETISVTASAPAISEVHVFGVPLGDSGFRSVKSAIERGENPRNVDVAGLVNYFAGAPARSPRGVSLDAEGSQAAGSGSGAMLRVSVDTARATPGLTPARQVRLSISFDPTTVASHRRLDGREGTLQEAALPHGLSVTMLHEVELRRAARGRDPVANIRLQYVDENGAEQTLQSVVRVSDLQRPWSRASRRQRLASLGALFGQNLTRHQASSDVALRAEELATQEPGDARARELATLASASSRLRSSAPTGSGR